MPFVQFSLSKVCCFLVILFYFLSFVFLSFDVSGLLAYVCCACRTQCNGMALHCLLPSLYFDVVSPCPSLLPPSLSLEDQQSAPTQHVLQKDVSFLHWE